MKFETYLDRRIFKTIRKHTVENPQTLVGIIGGVDAQERIMLTHRELAGGLERLVGVGYVAEVDGNKYYDATGSEGHATTFSGLTESEHTAAAAEYQRLVRKFLATMDEEPGEDDFVWLKLALRWAISGSGSATDEDEDGTDPFE